MPAREFWDLGISVPLFGRVRKGSKGTGECGKLGILENPVLWECVSFLRDIPKIPVLDGKSGMG